MSVIFTEGFDMYNGVNAGTGVPARWNIPNGDVVTVSGRFGGQGVRLTGHNTTDTYCYSVFDGLGATTSMAIGSAMLFNAITIYRQAVAIWNTSLQLQFYWNVTSSGGFQVINGSGTTLCSSAAGLVLANTWYYLELEVVMSSTVGTVNLYLNGASICSATGVNTQPNAGGGAFINLWTNGSTGAGSQTSYDDIYINNAATRLGECRVETLRPSSDVSVSWTPNSGANNYSRVNETLVDGDTSYVQTSTLNNADFYGNGGLSSTPSSIFAVNVVSFAEKTDATSRSIKNSVKSGSTTSDGSGQSLTSSYLRYDRILNTDPNTSAAWTASGVNNLQIGPKAA